MNHGESKEQIIKRWHEILIDYFALKEEVVKRVYSLDFHEIINTLKFEKSHICFTQRGSDNYLISNEYLELKYCYDDVYLDKIFPQYREQLSHYSEKYEETEYFELYKNNPDLNLLIKELELEYKDKAWYAFRSKYNRREHIDTLFKAWRSRACYGKCDFYFVIRYQHGLELLIEFLLSRYSEKNIDDSLRDVLNNPEQFSECIFNSEVTYWIF